VKQQLEINRLRVESIATSFREPSPAAPGPLDAELDFDLIAASAPTKAPKAVSEDEEDASEADDSILEVTLFVTFLKGRINDWKCVCSFGKHYMYLRSKRDLRESKIMPQAAIWYYLGQVQPRETQ
jgi:hypothetical protein